MMGEGGLMRAGRPFDAMDTALARFLLDLRSRGMIEKRLLDAFEATPRGPFLTDLRPGLLYMPINLPLPCGEEATDPFTLARQLVLLDVHPGMRVLEIGGGSGFSGVLMTRLGGDVVSVERMRTLVARATMAARLVASERIRFEHGDGLSRLDLARLDLARIDPGAPYDRILLNGALDDIPNLLLDRLAAGGRMLGHRRTQHGMRLTLFTIDANRVVSETDLGISRAGMLQNGLPTTL
jgi:protein-L-isoaspartate(D-aspartate) O-methyltransferase